MVEVLAVSTAAGLVVVSTVEGFAAAVLMAGMANFGAGRHCGRCGDQIRKFGAVTESTAILYNRRAIRRRHRLS